MYQSLVALSLASAAMTAPLNARDDTYPLTADLNCRSGPGTDHNIEKTYSSDESVTLSCQTSGESINGDKLWGKTSDGCYVADYYVSTGTSDYVVDKCGGGGGNTYAITADALNCRTGPGTSHSVVKTYTQSVTLTCQTTGESIRGDQLWGKTSDGCYVADYYVSTGTSDYVVDKCSGGGGSDGGDDGGSGDVGESILQKALAQKGTPYAWGGGTCDGPSGDQPPYDYGEVGFDCSGLVAFAVCQVTGRNLFAEGLRVTSTMYCAPESELKYKYVSSLSLFAYRNC